MVYQIKCRTKTFNINWASDILKNILNCMLFSQIVLFFALAPCIMVLVAHYLNPIPRLNPDIVTLCSVPIISFVWLLVPIRVYETAIEDLGET